MEDFLRGIYKFGAFKTNLELTVDACHRIDGQDVKKFFNGNDAVFSDFVNEYAKLDPEGANRLITDAGIVVNNQGDMLKFGDLIEERLLPPLKKFLEYNATIDVDVDENIKLVSSKSGFLNLLYGPENIYFHSQENPLLADWEYVEKLYDPAFDEYIVYGAGLGYMIYSLCIISDMSVKITVYEENPEMIELARNYGLLGEIPQELLHIETENASERFVKKAMEKSAGILIHTPSVSACRNNNIQNQIYSLWGNISTLQSFGLQYEINCSRNLNAGWPELGETDFAEMADEILVVAGGPSLDDDPDEFIRRAANSTVICVGTVYKKLMKMGIKPDLVCFVDPQANILSQVEGFENENTKLAIAVTTHYRVGRICRGEKRLIYTLSGVRSDLMEKMRGHQTNEWEVYGSVTSLATEIAIHARPKCVYFYGADFGFPDAKSHSAGTDFESVMNADELFETESVGGGKVYTDIKMNEYRRAVEHSIGNHPEIRFVNRSKTGARIKGTLEE
ncbi:MAG: DUF115 domain-containing protein [Acetatifactor sp.]|nr:DUF115 domain-containing protein [Acetatifactor sp.]